jgi:sugar phosphate isomerase/epimerase
MAELCFNCMNRSAFFLADEDPDLPGQIAAAGRAGFPLIGPDSFSIRRYCDAGGSLEALADQIRDAGMRTFELPALMVSDDESETLAESEAFVEIARVLEPDFIAVNVMSQASDSLIESLCRIGEAFGECGAKLAIEYLPWLPETRNIQSTRALIDKAGIAGAGIIVDTWHFHFSDDSWDDLAALPLAEISYIQFDDHPKLESDDLMAETIGRRALPGEGVFELDRFCEVMRAKGFDGVVSCEILSDETRAMDLSEFAERVFTTSRRFWS